MKMNHDNEFLDYNSLKDFALGRSSLEAKKIL